MGTMVAILGGSVVRGEVIGAFWKPYCGGMECARRFNLKSGLKLTLGVEHYSGRPGCAVWGVWVVSIWAHGILSSGTLWLCQGASAGVHCLLAYMFAGCKSIGSQNGSNTGHLCVCWSAQQCLGTWSMSRVPICVHVLICLIVVYVYVLSYSSFVCLCICQFIFVQLWALHDCQGFDASPHQLHKTS